jgi:hypothetical protein
LSQPLLRSPRNGRFPIYVADHDSLHPATSETQSAGHVPEQGAQIDGGLRFCLELSVNPREFPDA